MLRETDKMESRREGVQTLTSPTAAVKGSDNMVDSAPDSTRSPAFQFYPRDFLGDANVAVMTLQERGAYITLLCHCWTEGSLPADNAKLARLCGVSPPAMKKLWDALGPCFRTDTVSPGRLVQPRLEREREKQADFRRRQSDAATKRWHRPGTSQNDAVASDGQCRSDALLSSSSSASSDFSQTHTRGASALAGTLPRDHLSHAWCGRVCVPAFLHQQFVAGLGTDDADSTLRAFYGSTLDAISGPIAPDPVKFWRERVAAKWPAPSVTPPKPVGPAANVPAPFPSGWAAECNRLHGNECENYKAHAARLASEKAS